MHWTSELSALSLHLPLLRAAATENLKNEKTLTTHKQIKKHSIWVRLALCFFCISGYPWRHGLIGKSFWNAIWPWPSNVSAPPSLHITCSQHHFCSWWLRRIDWTPWFRLFWNIIHEWCLRQRAHCGGDLTLLITDMKSTEKESEHLFLCS